MIKTLDPQVSTIARPELRIRPERFEGRLRLVGQVVEPALESAAGVDIPLDGFESRRDTTGVFADVLPAGSTHCFDHRFA